MLRNIKVKYIITFVTLIWADFLLTAITVWCVAPIDGIILPMLAIALLVTAVGCIAVCYFARQLSSDLKMLSLAAKKLARGEFDLDIRVSGGGEISELVYEFNSMAKALSDLQKTQNVFLANVAHDLRTPMTSIAGFIDAMLDGVIPPEKEKHYLKIVSAEVRRLSELTTDVMDISRIEAGERKFVMTPFDICEMSRCILISLEQKIEDKGLDVELYTDVDRMIVLADRDAIYQVLYNICENAVKFASDWGKLSLSVKYEDKRSMSRIYVSVFNEGQGIPAEDIPYIFDRFYRGEKSASKVRGTGLGMFIAKAIIDAHDENISVKSVYGENCEFSFTLTPANEVSDGNV